ncbi:MAG: tetratricopeptide repeat protein [Planctomycetaceae bacterium]|jgi:Tfp pilus assembly protein PilF|nr:tetratricopeptide repeat protein [Planctomycetaceae bacterium]
MKHKFTNYSLENSIFYFYVNKFQIKFNMLIFFLTLFSFAASADENKISNQQISNQQIPTLKLDNEFIDSKSCAECHADIFTEWKKSDHANSMNHANEKNILADFNNTAFLHIGFDDILLLNDNEIKLLLNTIETSSVIFNPQKEYLKDDKKSHNHRYNISGHKMIYPPFEADLNDLALASFDSKTGILNRLRQNMSAQTLSKFDAELKFQLDLKFQRPCDISIARDKISNVLRHLITNGKIKTKCGTNFTMFRNNGKFKINTDIGEFEIKFTLGFRPIQQYLTATGDGKLQVLPIAWDVNSKRWFHLYPKEQIPKDDPLHWTSSSQNWNRMCAECHTTNLKKNFNPKTNKYTTTFSEINVGCQACHGACSKHDTTARKHKLLASWNPKIPKEVISLSNTNNAEIVNNCAFCHARRRLVQTPPKPPDSHAADWFVPEFIDTNTYYPDGQLLEEAFEYGSFIQSKMYSKGVGCVNCHEPHSLELKFQGNRLCAQCHSPSIYDTAKHHFHSDSNKPGTRCVECHFPQSTFMIVDPRRDHSIRKPNPALTITTGVPNACTICHHDRNKGETLEWANEKVESWYKEKRKSAVGYSDSIPINEHYSIALIAGKQNNPSAISNLIKIIRNKDNKEYRSVTRASAILILSRILRDNDIDKQSKNEILKICTANLTDNDDWVRFAAVSSLVSFDSEVRIKYLIPMLNDSRLAVRVEAARALADQINNFRNDNVKNLFEKVKQEYINSQYVNSDQPAAFLNLAAFEYDLVTAKIAETNRWLIGTTQGLSQQDTAYIESQKIAIGLIKKLTKKPLELYKQSIDIDRSFFPSRINLAMLYNERSENEASEHEFREALRIEPTNGNAAYSLGLLLAERGKFEESIQMLNQAVKNFEQQTLTESIMLPKSFVQSEIVESSLHRATKNRVRYNLALLLLQMKRYNDAKKELEIIIKSEPQNTTFLYALVVLFWQNGEKQKASEIIDKLIKLEPQNQQWKRLKN